MRHPSKGFTLIEIMVVLSIIALLSAVVFSAISAARVKARDMSRIANANQIDKALQMFVDSGNVVPADAGLASSTAVGTGLISMDASQAVGYRGKSIARSLQEKGYYSRNTLLDPVYGVNNYYLAYCSNKNIYSILMKVEQDNLKMSSSSLAQYCGGDIALAQGYNYIYQANGAGAGADSSAALAGGLGTGSSTLGAVGVLSQSFAPGIGAPGSGMVSVVQSDGKVISAGAFSHLGNSRVGNIVRFNIDGSVDSSFASGVGTNGAIGSMTIQPSDGKIFVGGNFTSYNGTAKKYLMRLNTDGSLDASFAPSVDSAVDAIAVQGDGNIVIGGDFTNVNGVSAGRIARLSSTGVVDSSFATNIGTGFNSTVVALCIQSDGRILVGGGFWGVNSVSQPYHARLLSSGMLDATFGSVTPNMPVYAITQQSDGKIIEAGIFTSYGGNAAKGVMRIASSTGAFDSSFNITTYGFTYGGNTASVSSVLVDPSGNIVVSGGFDKYGTTSVNGVVRLKPDASLDSAFVFTGGVGSMTSGIGTSVASIARRSSDGAFVLSGTFDLAGGQGHRAFAKISSTGATDAAFNPLSTYYDYDSNSFATQVTGVKADTGGKFIAFGAFTLYANTPVERIMRVNVDGSIDSSFAASGGANNKINSAYRQTDGKYMIVGQFTTYAGQPRHGVARINSDGSLDATFGDVGVVSGSSAQMVSVVTQSDGKVVVAGNFLNIGGQTRNGIARFSSTGVLESNATYVADIPATVSFSQMSIQGDDKIILTGSMSTFDGAASGNIVRINTNGTKDSTFTASFDSFAIANTFDAQGRLLVSGAFSTLNGTPVPAVVRLTSTGALDTSFNFAGADGQVSTLLTQSDGSVYLGGPFTKIGSTARGGIARITNAGSVDAGFEPGGAFPSGTLSAQTISLFPDNSLVVGGFFNSYDGTATNKIVRLR